MELSPSQKKAKQKIEDFLLTEGKKKKILVVTHDFFQAKRLADEIIFLNHF